MDDIMKGQILWGGIIHSLPMTPDFDKNGKNKGFWTNGELILCPTAEAAENIADFLESLGIADCAVTGYFDPEADAYDGTLDRLSGWHYADIA